MGGCSRSLAQYLEGLCEDICKALGDGRCSRALSVLLAQTGIKESRQF